VSSRTTPSNESASASAAGPPVTITTSDGRRLRGRDYGVGDDWAVIVPGKERDTRTWSGLVADLTSRGFRVLTFDRGRHSAGGSRILPWRRGDVRAALSYARSHGATRLFVIGAGTGATTALHDSARFPVRALVALSPRVGRHARNKPPPEETRAPKLIIVGSLDPRAAQDAEIVFRRSIGWTLLNSAPVPAQGTALFTSSWGRNVREQITAFLLDYLEPRHLNSGS
jgi:alpha-beta hydrolase superfamily lysophospholipase